MPVHLFEICCLQVPGGWLADRFGGKWLFGGCVLLSSVITVLSPAAAEIHIDVFITLRVLSGLGEGVLLPAAQAMIVRWSAPKYRSLIVSVIFAGINAGVIIGMFLSGVLCDYGFAGGWPSAFYVCGVIGCVWSAAWFLLCYNSPCTHPRISTAERKYWEATIGTIDIATHTPTQWQKIFTSVPVWALVVVCFANNWGATVMTICLPLYMHDVLGMDMTSNATLSAVPFAVEVVTLPLAGLFVDLLRSPGRLSTNLVRKIFCFAGFTLACCFFIVMGYIGCNRTLAVATLCAIALCRALACTTIDVNPQDLAPLHAGRITGLASSFASLASAVAPVAVSVLTYQKLTRSGWWDVFFVSAGIYIVGAVVFIVFGSGNRQSWADDSSLQ